jgi:hypothetical protein
MPLSNGHGSCRYWEALLLAILVLAAGCQTSRLALFTAAGPGWRVQEGQALWRPRHGLPELGGDLVMASHADGQCALEFAKTPVALVVAQTTRTNWLVRFPPRDMGFSGRGKPSVRFAWLYLHAALAGEPLPAQFRFERKPDGGWRLENTRTGETLEGYLAP